MGCPGRLCFPLLLPGLQLFCHHGVSPQRLKKNHSTSCRLVAKVATLGKNNQRCSFFKDVQIGCVKTLSTQFVLRLCTGGLHAYLQVYLRAQFQWLKQSLDFTP